MKKAVRIKESQMDGARSRANESAGKILDTYPRLGKAHRKILQLVYEECMEIEELARELNTDTKSAGKRLYNALRALKYWSEHDPDDFSP